LREGGAELGAQRAVEDEVRSAVDHHQQIEHVAGDTHHLRTARSLLIRIIRNIMTGVKRLDKVRNTTVLTSVSRNELIHTVHDRQLRFLGHMLRNTHSPHASIRTISANSRHNKSWPSSTKLHGIYREADWNEDQRTRGGVTRP